MREGLGTLAGMSEKAAQSIVVVGDEHHAQTAAVGPKQVGRQDQHTANNRWRPPTRHPIRHVNINARTRSSAQAHQQHAPRRRRRAGRHPAVSPVSCGTSAGTSTALQHPGLETNNNRQTQHNNAPGGLLIQLRHLHLEQGPGDLSHDASTITRHIISGASAAVLHAPQCSERLHARTQMGVGGWEARQAASGSGGGGVLSSTCCSGCRCMPAARPGTCQLGPGSRSGRQLVKAALAGWLAAHLLHNVVLMLVLEGGNQAHLCGSREVGNSMHQIALLQGSSRRRLRRVAAGRAAAGLLHSLAALRCSNCAPCLFHGCTVPHLKLQSGK